MQQWQQHPDVLTELLDGEAVLLLPGTGVLHRLDPVATQVWLALVEPVAPDLLVAGLAERFVAEPRQVEKDVVQLLAQLDGAGLLQRP